MNEKNSLSLCCDAFMYSTLHTYSRLYTRTHTKNYTFFYSHSVIWNNNDFVVHNKVFFVCTAAAAACRPGKWNFAEFSQLFNLKHLFLCFSSVYTFNAEVICPLSNYFFTIFFCRRNLMAITARSMRKEEIRSEERGEEEWEEKVNFCVWSEHNFNHTKAGAFRISE
jgi:hypothetical protein